MAESFNEFVRRATGHDPYPYQCRVADEGLPELLEVPTGSGKTLAAVLPWLFRRRYHPDEGVRGATPHWLVFVLPMRVLVEQTADSVRGWVANLGLEGEVGVHVVMGGEGRLENEWRRSPEKDAIFLGTLDMLLSRALNRGYGESRFTWPIDFGLFNNGCQWVFDEIQLMGPALPTSRQLQGLREKIGTALPCASMWMSATVDKATFPTVDRPSVGVAIEIADADRTGPLKRRLDATKRIEHIEVEPRRYAKSIADALAKRHREGSLTIAVLNTVARAREVASALAPLTDVEVVLLHSRFRPAERAEQARRALAPVEPGSTGRILVSTQVLEAGVDISATTMFTEAAPWPSIVQRAGRCNRDGEALGAVLLWTTPPKPGPYEGSDVEAATRALELLEGQELTAPRLGVVDVPVKPVVHPVLRRRDLVDLFDTTSGLSGNDIDVSRFIRDDDDGVDLLVAWRGLSDDGPRADDPVPARDELCPVPVHELRELMKKRDLRPWYYDHLDARWASCGREDLRPGQLVIVRASAGGYSAVTGWDPNSREPVEVIAPDARDALAPPVEATGADLATFSPRVWLSLAHHLADVEKEVRDLIGDLTPEGLSTDHLEAAALAGRLHDVGKAHPVFQQTLMDACHDGEEPVPADGSVLWAKSGGTKQARHARRYFRHELASALVLLSDGDVALEGVGEPDLVRYLVAAHHGRVRLGIRALPDETADRDYPDRRIALGVWDGEVLPAIEIPGGLIPAAVLDLSTMELGDGTNGLPSWSARMLALRDRPDLGVFRLGFLEALVRLADWRASANPSGEEPV